MVCDIFISCLSSIISWGDNILCIFNEMVDYKLQYYITVESMEYEAQLRHKNEMARIEAELAGKAKIDRENRDLNLEMMREKAKESRETMLEGIK